MTPRKILADFSVDLLLPLRANITLGESADQIIAALDKAGFAIIVKPDDPGAWLLHNQLAAG
jgi:hypothetical protein